MNIWQRNSHNDAVELIQLVAPERKDDLQKLFTRYSPSFCVGLDCSRFVVEANPLGFVRFTDRTILHIWLLGWVMWKEMYCWSSSIYFLAIDKKPFVLSELNAASDQQQSYIDADTLYSEALSFIKSDPMNWSLWPQHVPRPDPQVILSSSKEDQLINDFAHYAVAFFLLHEFKHLILAHDGGTNHNHVEDEFACDYWALDYLVANSDTYATAINDDPLIIKSRRAMGIALGAAVIAHIQTIGLWDHGLEHPPVAERINRLALSLALPDNDLFWIVAGSFILACLRRQNSLPDRIEFENHREFLAKLLFRQRR